MNKIKLPKTNVPIKTIMNVPELAKACLSVLWYSSSDCNVYCVDCALDSLENFELYKNQEELCL